MNDALDLIMSRRSVREYKDSEVENEKLFKILEAARWSPSSGNVQNWRFVVINEPNLKMQLAEACLGQYWITTVPVIIVVLSDDSKLRTLFGERGESTYSIENCSIAVQNMMLEAKSIGLDTCWLGAFDEDKVLRVVKSEDPNVHVRGVVALGYAAQIPPPPNRIALKEIVFFNEYGNKMVK
ncbi:malonic semialdehyde reductase RutE [Candidatus Tiddalikarchaeum anstoanum]|nr:malonic semialdehyde reductase RutE [Candidatus Tiddalikarchaeum anstoanum]